MRTKILLVLALVALMAAPAFAAVQNVKVSGDIDSTYINRQDFNLGTSTGPTVPDGLVNQNAFITQTRVRIDADLSDNVSTTVGLINERAWDAETGVAGSQDTDVQLYLAYATLREFLYSPLTLSVGRQVFHYGNGLILGDGGVNNAATGNLAGVAADLTKRTSYDGVKAILDYKPLTLDLIYFKNSSSATNTGAVTAAGVPATANDSTVFGINANYQLGDPMNTAVEGYLFSRINGKNAPAALAGAGATGLENDTLYVPGLRISTNPINGLNVQGEVAWQTGNKQVTGGGLAGGDNQRREAMAYQFMGSYTLPVLEKYKPMVNASFTHVSGDKNAGTSTSSTRSASREVFQAWDPLNEAQGSGTIYNTLYNLTNMNIFTVGGTVTPMEDVTVSAAWSHLAADKLFSAVQNPLTLIQPDGSSGGAITPVMSGRSLGNEYDANINYAYTEDVTFGMSFGWYVPGKDFAEANRNIASQALAHVLVNF